MAETILRVEDFSYSYIDGDKERAIFRNVNCDFDVGSFCAISGDSGSGKTTFLYCVAGLDDRYTGCVFYKNKDIKEIGRDFYRRNIVSIVFQNYNLITYLSPLENIKLAMDISDDVKQYDDGVILGLLRHMGIDEQTAYRRTSSLSGGEQQRVAIARAFAKSSDIILADEPTGNLDESHSLEIINLFKQLAHEYNKCVIMVTHNPKLYELSDKLYFVDQNTKKIVIQNN